MEDVLIELRAFKYFPSLSEETIAFTASIFINGKYAGEAKNQGHGGPTDYRADYGDPKKIAAVKLAEEWCRQQPDIEFGKEGDTFKVKMNLELYIDQLVDEKVKEIEHKKLERQAANKMKRAILFGIDIYHSYKYVQFSSNIEWMVSRPAGINSIKKVIAEFKSNAKPGEQILNTNIPKEWL